MRALALLLIPLLLSGCASSPPEEPPSAPHGASHAGGEKLFSDVHGLAYDAAMDTLWVATHTGLNRRVGDGAWEAIGPRQDLMGFSRDPARPNVFYASGHPAGGGNLGAIRSEDGGATWNAVGAPGADFHAMIATKDALYGSYRGAVHRSTDQGATWEQRGLLAAAAFASAEGTLYATTGKEVAASADGGASWRSVASLPAYGLAASGAQTLYVGTPGGVQKSTDGGRTWSATLLPTGQRVVGHLHVDANAPDILHAASYDGFVWRSDDAGATWTGVRAT